jgi:hypothetical protein
MAALKFGLGDQSVYGRTNPWQREEGGDDLNYLLRKGFVEI